MEIQEFINKNWKEIEQAIRVQAGHNDNTYFMDNDEMELWILNDESLYNWARSEGVDV
jgi:hypothetical protein